MAFCLDKTRRFFVHSLAHSLKGGVGEGGRRVFSERRTKNSASVNGVHVEKIRQKVILRPNFFVGVKLDGMDEKVIEVQNKIFSFAQPVNISKTFTSSKKMHLTGIPLVVPMI